MLSSGGILKFLEEQKQAPDQHMHGLKISLGGSHTGECLRVGSGTSRVTNTLIQQNKWILALPVQESHAANLVLVGAKQQWRTTAGSWCITKQCSTQVTERTALADLLLCPAHPATVSPERERSSMPSSPCTPSCSEPREGELHAFLCTVMTVTVLRAPLQASQAIGSPWLRCHCPSFVRLRLLNRLPRQQNSK